MVSMNNDASKTKNCLGIHGPALEEIFLGLKAVDEAVKNQRKSAPVIAQDEMPQESGSAHRKSAPAATQEAALESGNGEDINYSLKKQKEKYSSLKQLTASLKETEKHLSNNFFDKVEMIVVESLRRDHFSGFRESEKYSKLRNFLWFKDRPVVPVG